MSKALLLRVMDSATTIGRNELITAIRECL